MKPVMNNDGLSPALLLISSLLLSIEPAYAVARSKDTDLQKPTNRILQIEIPTFTKVSVSSATDAGSWRDSDQKNRPSMIAPEPFGHSRGNSDMSGSAVYSSPSSLTGLLEFITNPNAYRQLYTAEEIKAELKASLPTTAWFFLTGILGFLGIKKRKMLG